MKISNQTIQPLRVLMCALIVCTLLPGALFAQFGNGQRYPGTYPPNRGGRVGNRGRGGNQCLQQAGLTQATMQQVRSLHEQARAEIESLCSNTSLSAQQRQERIREIEQRTKQQAESLISPAQRERLQACQASSGRGGHGGFGGGRGGLGSGGGPCGQLPGRNF